MVKVTHLRRWDLTAVEIAVDLEVPPFPDPPSLGFSGPAEPRVCLVAAFALTPQLKRIIAAIDRALPARLPPTLRIAPSRTREGASATGGPVSILPMTPLIRIQSRLIRAIAPGLADLGAYAPDMDEAISHYIREFISSSALPALEPSHPPLATPAEVTPLGVSFYHLDRIGKPKSILGHWAYAPGVHRNVPLRGGP